MIIAVVWIETKEKVFSTNVRPPPTNLLHTNMISVLTVLILESNQQRDMCSIVLLLLNKKSSVKIILI